MDKTDDDSILAFIVWKHDLSKVCRCLKERGLHHDQYRPKLLFDSHNHPQQSNETSSQRFCVPTKYELNSPEPDADFHVALYDARLELNIPSAQQHLQRLQLYGSTEGDVVDFVPTKIFTTPTNVKTQQTPKAIISSAFGKFTKGLSDKHADQDYSIDCLMELPSSFTIYGNMMLLDVSPPCIQHWKDHADKYADTEISFLSTLAQATRVTHIAINAPIPLLDEGNQRLIDSVALSIAARAGPTANVLRSPKNLLPLYGDFGSLISGVPTRAQLDQAFWTYTVQNGIKQIWAPRYTMFSEGNHREKARLLTLRSIKLAVEQGRMDNRGCAAVDLYVGIGYFAFSYLKAGVDLVLGWDLNPWSVEGLRRGAGENRWVIGVEGDGLSDGVGEKVSHRMTEKDQRSEVEVPGRLIIKEHSRDTTIPARSKDDAQKRLWAWCEDNQNAAGTISRLRKAIPPVRHVNCGLLPTSRGSWKTAVRSLDHEMGGWIHVHENFKELDLKSTEVREQIERLVRDDSGWPDGTTVTIDEVFRVKSYAPGVFHFVIDILIDPSGATQEQAGAWSDIAEM